MADRNQLKKAVDSHRSDDDPFAELTRVMGFDPRVPVSRAQPAAVEKLAPLAAEEDDFSIDLEKELMGEFESLDEEVQATSEPAAARQFTPETAEDDTLSEDFDFVFDADLASEEHDPAIAAAADKALNDELHAAFAGGPVQDVTGAAEMRADAFAGEIPVDEPKAPVEAAAEAELAAEFETAFAEETAEEPAAPTKTAEEETLVGELETVFAKETVAEELDAASNAIGAEILPDAIGETFAVHFEDHLAADAAGVSSVVEPELESAEETETAAETEAEAGGHEASELDTYDDAPLIPLGAARDLAGTDDSVVPVDMDFGAELADELAQLPDEPSAHATEPEDDNDLEAELSALLGKGMAAGTGAQATVAPSIEAEAADEPVLSAAGASGEPAASLDDDWAVDSDDPLPMAAETVESEPLAAPQAGHSGSQAEEPAMASEEGRAEASGQDQPEPDVPAYASAAQASGEPAASLDDDWAVDSDDPLPMAAETVESEPLATPQAGHSGSQAEEPAMASEEGRAEAAGQDQPEPDLPASASATEAPNQEEAPFPDEDDPLREFVVEQELQAELAALEGHIDLTVDDLVLADEPPAHAAHGEDERSLDGPAIADEPAIEAVAEDETVPAEMIDGPIKEQPVPEAPVAPAPPPRAQEPLAAEEDDDPFAILAAMVRDTQPVPSSARPAAPASTSYQELSRSNAPTASESPKVSTTEYQYQNHLYTNRAPANVPDIDTVEVPENAVALADDLDIPDISFEDDLPLAADLDDFEAELASAFNQQAAGPAQPTAEPVREPPRESYQHEYAQYHPASMAPGYHGGAAVTAATAYASAQPAPRENDIDDRYGHVDGSGGLAGDHAPDPYRAMDDDDLAYDPELNEDMAIVSNQDGAERQSYNNRRGLMIAAIVGGVVLIGGIGAFALSGGGNGSGAPALVRADTDPVKVRPENPGGTNVPNQDNKVFQTMNGTDRATAPVQEKLISGTEEPVDVAARAEPRVVTPQPPAENGEAAIEDAPLMADEEAAAEAQDPIAAEIASAPKGEDRVAPAAEEPATNNDVVAVAPRRVRTMVVRADGTLVPSEEPAAVQPQSDDTTASALEPADPAKSLADPIAPEATGSLKPSGAAPAEAAGAPAAVEPVPAPKPAATANRSAMPASGPVAPSRPGNQPVDIVGEVKPQQVAAAGATAAAGAWSMQIASQPSEAAAQSSYEDLARRYGNVIGGRGVNIVKAEIAGKGTFWRVRVPAGSRNEAISLCESYKAAGGNCFVSK
jgi:hypothetical protein